MSVMPLSMVYRPGEAHHRDQKCLDSFLTHSLEVLGVLIAQRGLWLAVQSVAEEQSVCAAFLFLVLGLGQ